MLVCSLATHQAFQWTQCWTSPCTPGVHHTVLWGGHLDWFLHWSHFPSSKYSGPDPPCLRWWISWEAAARNGAEVPVRALGGWGKSRWCSADVSVGIASIAIQQAQVWFSSLVQLRQSAYKARQLICNPPWFLPVSNFVCHPLPCCHGVPYWQKFNGVCKLQISRRCVWLHPLCSDQRQLDTAAWFKRQQSLYWLHRVQKFLLQLQFQMLDHFNPSCFERPKTHRTESLNGTMVDFYQRFLSNCSWLEFCLFHS